MENLTGKQFGAYHIVGPLGAGGMASVYKAYQPGIDRYVALKVLPRQFANDPQFFGRFEQEAKVLAKLQHPHILSVYDYGQAEGYTYIVMPFVESGDLADILRGKRLSLTEIGQIISQVGDALDYAHAQGVVHRDVKPSNILVDKRGNCLLTDFGIAKILEGSTDSLTVTGGVIGTPSYMSPEQGMGKKLDGRSDIYALGIILYQMVTGEVPFKAETPMAVMIKHINDPLLSPRDLNADIPQAIERVTLKALAKQPEDRHETAGEMVKALQQAVTESASTNKMAPVPETLQVTSLSQTAAEPKPLPDRVNQTVPPASTQKNVTPLMLWGAVGATAVLLLGIIAGVLFLRQPPGGPPPPPPGQDSAAPVQNLPSPSGQDAAAPGQNPPPQSDGPLPPPEAIEASRTLSQGATCQVQTPREPLQGTCQLRQEQLACIPLGGGPGAPPPPRN
jgi:serine/threonine protein kinase